eukprot:gene4221-4917_t
MGSDVFLAPPLPLSLTCYCDPSVLLFKFVQLGDCPEMACRVYGIFFLFIFMIMLMLAVRNIYPARSNMLCPSVVGNTLMAVGSALMMVRFAMIVARITERYSLSALLLYGVACIFSSYLWILVFWCKLMVNITSSPIVKRILPVARWVIVVLNFSLFIMLTVGLAIYWPGNATNAIISIYGFGESIGFVALGTIMFREFRAMAEGYPENLSREIHAKMARVTRLSAMVVVTAILMTTTMVTVSYWRPKTTTEAIVWLFVSRTSFVLFGLSLLVVRLSPRTPRNTMSDKPPPLKYAKQDIQLDSIYKTGSVHSYNDNDNIKYSRGSSYDIAPYITSQSTNSAYFSRESNIGMSIDTRQEDNDYDDDVTSSEASIEQQQQQEQPQQQQQ